MTTLIDIFKASTLRAFSALVLPLLFLASGALADSVLLLDADFDAMASRFLLMDEAKKELQVSYFIFKGDTTGMATLASLRAAAKRGVAVKVILDNSYQKLTPEMLTFLMDEGVQVKMYHPFSLSAPYASLTERMHDKLMIADRERAITGGRNIQNGFFTDRKVSNFRFYDLDVYVSGKAVKNAGDYHAGLFESAHVEPPKRMELSDEARRKLTRQFDRYQKINESFLRKVNGQRHFYNSRISEARSVKFFHDPIGEKGRAPGTEQGWLEQIRKAEKTIDIENPYVILTDDFKAELKKAVDRGVKVRVMTNAGGAGDIRIAEALYEKERGELFDMGIEVYEKYGTRGTVHGKALCVDSKSLFIGSYNLDPRSRNLNMEVGFAIESEPLARSFEGRFHRWLREARLYNPRLHDVPPAWNAEGCRRRVMNLIAPFVRSQI